MNTANLQLEGLLMAIASINKTLVSKGILTTEEIDKALATSEQLVVGDDRAVEELSPANRDAIAFPIRLLRQANSQGSDDTSSFSQLTRTVGETKDRYNDQL
ncbi:MAG: hypothetical protein IR164_12155 [Devosia sp.]|jgi:hypothetical protein|uniref:hypothetical protein n=1 Tax=unclassified Devosia TaxID=196773 RepID=UPI0019FCD499|nr:MULTISPECIES: hypothetical protein [unclassified Devosia]MBF0679675.1 hypothetical protein [Devosia sp.]WEJ32155.1 hypothetical protein NYQ88_14765 [Devosia sp. SD17-2]